MFQKRIIRFLKLTKLQRKQQPKCGLLRLLLSLLIKLAFFIGLAQQDCSIQKQNKVHLQFPLFIWCFDFYFRYTCLNDLFCVEKNQMLCEKSNHIIRQFKKNNSRISLSQLSVSSFLEQIHSAKEKYQVIKFFIKSSANQNFYLQH